MKITGLKEQVRDLNRVNVFVDGSYSFSLTISQIIDEKIKVSAEIDDSRLVFLKKLSEEGKIYMRAQEWLMRRPHSEKEFKDYLYQKKVDPALSNSLIDRLTQAGYLSDTRFAEWWAEGRLRKNKSLRSIIFELTQKGVSHTVIQQALSVQEASNQTENSFGDELNSPDASSLEAVIQKVATRSRYQDENKLIRYLQSKGFSYGAIKSALAKYREL